MVLRTVRHVLLIGMRQVRWQPGQQACRCCLPLLPRGSRALGPLGTQPPNPRPLRRAAAHLGQQAGGALHRGGGSQHSLMRQPVENALVHPPAAG